jgi:hypothetical protein
MTDETELRKDVEHILRWAEDHRDDPQVTAKTVEAFLCLASEFGIAIR